MERVIGIGGVAEDTPTDALHHGAMPLDKRRESRFVAEIEKPAQELAIAVPLGALRADSAQQQGDCSFGSACHVGLEKRLGVFAHSP